MRLLPAIAVLTAASLLAPAVLGQSEGTMDAGE